MSRIKVIRYEQADGRLKEIYDELIEKRGKLADVHTIQSLRPESIVKHMDLYLEIMFSRSDLSRAQREMIAVVVSASNLCGYCQIHHAEALNHYWKDDKRIELLKKDFRDASLTENEMALCFYAETLTLDPASAQRIDIVQPLRDNGFSDAAILDATLVISYFNFVNRIVLALNVELEADGAADYKY